MNAPFVFILSGGLSHERDVSLRSGRRVAEALRAAGCRVVEGDLDNHLVPRLLADRPDIVWPLLHGASGEDGSVRDVLDLLHIPYVGSDPRAARLAWNKSISKTALLHRALPTPDFVTLSQSLFREMGAANVLELLGDRFGLPVMIKPESGGSALGTTLVSEAERLPRALVDCFSYGPVALIEEAVSGTEIAVGVIDLGSGPFALPAVEIVCEGPYDYDARYNPGRAEFFTPARLDDAVAARAAAVAVAAHETFRMARLSRIDMIVDQAGVPWIIDVNVAPGMQETSLLPQAALAAGYGLPQLYRAIVEAALTDPPAGRARAVEAN